VFQPSHKLRFKMHETSLSLSLPLLPFFYFILPNSLFLFCLSSSYFILLNSLFLACLSRSLVQLYLSLSHTFSFSDFVLPNFLFLFCFPHSRSLSLSSCSLLSSLLLCCSLLSLSHALINNMKI